MVQHVVRGQKYKYHMTVIYRWVLYPMVDMPLSGWKELIWSKYHPFIVKHHLGVDVMCQKQYNDNSVFYIILQKTYEVSKNEFIFQ